MTDPRIEAIVAIPDDLQHVWVIAQHRCFCGVQFTDYADGARHIRLVRAERLLAAADAVDPLRRDGEAE